MHWQIADSLEQLSMLSVGCMVTVHKEYVPERVADMDSYLEEAKLWLSSW